MTTVRHRRQALTSPRGFFPTSTVEVVDSASPIMPPRRAHRASWYKRSALSDKEPQTSVSGWRYAHDPPLKPEA